jgi:hypothetical protein
MMQGSDLGTAFCLMISGALCGSKTTQLLPNPFWTIACTLELDGFGMSVEHVPILALVYTFGGRLSFGSHARTLI